MKIGIIISRIGGEDGVALESEKWIEVLQEMKHKVFISSGRFKGSMLVNKKYQKKIKDLSFGRGLNEKERKKVFGSATEDPQKILKKINQRANEIAKKLNQWIKDNHLKLLILENTNALPVHLPLAKAIKDVIEKTGIKAISHNHDFYWERDKYYKSSYKEINNLVKDLFPLKLPQVTHVVINNFSKNKLKNDFGIEAVYIPNVMNFKKAFGQKTIKNKNLPKEIGLKKDDIPLFQITRIIRRKNIETAIDLVKRLDDKRVKLVVTGTADDDPGKIYYKELKNLIKKLKIEKQILFKGDKFCKRGFFVNLFKNSYRGYSSSDAYAYAVACTYFSKYEGFGNAFIEAVAAKKPIFVNNYKPVFQQDIGNKGFKVVMVNNGNLTKKALKEIEEIIYNEKLAKEIGKFNFDIGRKYFSYEVLKTKLENILGEIF